MKEFHVEVRIKNNLVRRRRIDMGLTIRQAADACGVNYSRWCAIESMAWSPVLVSKNRCGEWKPLVHKLCEFLGCLPEDLFPDAVLKVKKNRTEREISAAEIRPLLVSFEQNRLRLLVDHTPEDDACAVEDRRNLEYVLSTIPERRAQAVRLYFLEELAMKEVARRMSITTNYARQLVESGLRWLQDPSRSCVLKGIPSFRWKQFHNEELGIGSGDSVDE